MGKNLLVISLGFLCWWGVGWALAYGTTEDPNKFSGFNQFFASGFMDDKTLFRNFFFQGAFCATGGTIVSGAMAERTKLTGFAIYTVFMTSIIYPIVVYWGWSGSGFLNYTDDAGESVSIAGPAYMDFAGSGLVHLVGGVGALCGAIFVGARKGRFDESVNQEEFVAHSVPFQALGTLVLWFGWFGFNPGSTLSMSSKDAAYTAGIVAVNTTLAPCVAGLVVFLLKAIVLPPKLLDVGAFCNGILAGLVSITAGCAAVKAWEAMLIGFIGGAVYIGASEALQRLQIDDVVDAFPVHGACGIWGTLALGLFGNPDEGLGGNGNIYNGNQFVTQFVGVLVIIAWVSATSSAVFYPLKMTNMLRLSDSFQDQGADAMEHTPTKAYVQPNADFMEHSPSKQAYGATPAKPHSLVSVTGPDKEAKE